MNNQEYRFKLDQLKDPTPTNLLALGEWVQSDALPWLWNELGGAILAPRPHHPRARILPAPRVLRPMIHKDAVRHGLMTSSVDESKLQEPLFYQAQLTMLTAEVERYGEAIERYPAQSAHMYADCAVHTLHRALHEIMSVATVLLEDAAQFITGLPGYFGAWRRQREHPFEVFKGAEQIIYGTYSGMAHADRAPYAPIAVLRTAIELRLRYAFGVSSLTDPRSPENEVPIALSALFEAIRKHQPKINFTVDIHDVWKIYRWSNYYLHYGMRDYPWVPGFLLQYLRPILAGQPNDVNGGIRLGVDTWRAVRESLVASRRTCLAERFVNAWHAFVGRSRRFQLPAFDENDAQCVFVD